VETLGKLGLLQRGVEGGHGRGRYPLGDPTSRAAPRSEAASEDRHLQPQVGLRPGRDAGEHTLVGSATKTTAKICAYTYGFYAKRILGLPRGRIK
jgi:hypothetical protein